MASDRFDHPTMLETMGVYAQSNEDRGSSMVRKHYEKLQQEKENAAMGKLHGLMPQLGFLVRALALQETDWNVEKAALLLRRFQLANTNTLNQLHKKRKHLVNASNKKSGTAKAPGVKAGTSEPPRGMESKTRMQERDGSSEDTDSPESETHRHKAHSLSKKRSPQLRKRKKKSRTEKHKKKRSRREDSDVDDHAPAMYQYGKYGIIRESDIYAKRSEFVVWAAEVKKIDCESMPRQEEKELFREYIEDYNTGTLPHRKYYDLEVYEKQKREKAAARGGGRAKERVLFNDEEELRKEKERERLKLQQDRMREAWEELQYTGKAEDMRRQELLRMEMSLAYRTGDTDKAQKLADRLKPDDQKDPRRELGLK